jgi:hypothetical protein
MEKKTHITTDHDTIMDWVEARGGYPAIAPMAAGKEGIGTLRIVFDDDDEEMLEPVEWEKFFYEFEDNGLAFLYQIETTDGEESRFNKFVDRIDHEDEIEEAIDDDLAVDDFSDDDEDDDALGDIDDSDDEEVM